jgi:hypothetical protein
LQSFTVRYFYLRYKKMHGRRNSFINANAMLKLWTNSKVRDETVQTGVVTTSTACGNATSISQETHFESEDEPLSERVKLLSLMESSTAVPTPHAEDGNVLDDDLTEDDVSSVDVDEEIDDTFPYVELSTAEFPGVVESVCPVSTVDVVCPDSTVDVPKDPTASRHVPDAPARVYHRFIYPDSVKQQLKLSTAYVADIDSTDAVASVHLETDDVTSHDRCSTAEVPDKFSTADVPGFVESVCLSSDGQIPATFFDRYFIKSFSDDIASVRLGNTVEDVYREVLCALNFIVDDEDTFGRCVIDFVQGNGPDICKELRDCDICNRVGGLFRDADYMVKSKGGRLIDAFKRLLHKDLLESAVCAFDERKISKETCASWLAFDAHGIHASMQAACLIFCVLSTKGRGEVNRESVRSMAEEVADNV